MSTRIDDLLSQVIALEKRAGRHRRPPFSSRRDRFRSPPQSEIRTPGRGSQTGRGPQTSPRSLKPTPLEIHQIQGETNMACHPLAGRVRVLLTRRPTHRAKHANG